MKREHINILVGKQLSSVEFVQDYLQLHFDGNHLTCYVWPKIHIVDKINISKDSNYKNLLCDIIGEIVSQVELEEETLLKIVFESRKNIELNLDLKNPEIVTEIAYFIDENNEWSVFE